MNNLPRLVNLVYVDNEAADELDRYVYLCPPDSQTEQPKVELATVHYWSDVSDIAITLEQLLTIEELINLDNTNLTLTYNQTRIAKDSALHCYLIEEGIINE